ncbi:MAG: nucleotidyltransferase domain-containing protein [Hydrogenophaga sp.]|uniref:nucleotidyltransferase domain-containing protein n=1 Tax=Hydrogenophaga sp. TaxID=1904254 RepID=UPI003D9B312B
MSALTTPGTVASLSPVEWDELIRLARSADVLARLDVRIQAVGLLSTVPLSVRRHLGAARLLAQRQQDELAYEISVLSDVLEKENIQLVLLKGAAYAAAHMQTAMGRMVSDVDVLVPQDRLVHAEAALMRSGWLATNRDVYDQHYYRKWMHEIPPLQHVHRGSVLDVHHAVVPPTAGYRLDSRVLLEAAVPVKGSLNVRVLCDVDMVLHSAVHLMHEGELELGFRGLLDLDLMLRELSDGAGFWSRLIDRAVLLGLQRPAFLALRYAQMMLATPVPREALDGLQARAQGVGAARLALLDFLYVRGLQPDHPNLSDGWTAIARQVLYLRSHFMRMPWYLLLPHLVRKSIRRLLETFNSKQGVTDAAA